jgi:hypothetical protein
MDFSPWKKQVGRMLGKPDLPQRIQLITPFTVQRTEFRQ